MAGIFIAAALISYLITATRVVKPKAVPAGLGPPECKTSPCIPKMAVRNRLAFSCPLLCDPTGYPDGEMEALQHVTRQLVKGE